MNQYDDEDIARIGGVRNMLVLDKKHISKYLGMDARLDAGLRMIAEGLVEGQADGKYIDSDRMYHNIETYQTKSHEMTRYEAHDKYIDIQYLRAGQERIDVLASRDGLKETERNEDADLFFYEAEDMVKGHQVSMKAGMLAVFYPEDVHRPGMCLDQTETVEKIVFKIKVDEL